MKFEWNTKQYEIDDETAMAAYGYQTQQKRLADARRHLEFYVFGLSTESTQERYIEDSKRKFREEQGIDYALMLVHLERVAENFEILYTEDQTAESLWEQAVERTIDELVEQHSHTSYDALAEACRNCDSFLVTMALNTVLQLGASHIDDDTTINIFRGSVFSEETKQKALELVQMMRKAPTDVLLAFVQREAGPFTDARGERIPYLHPHGDEERLCPECCGSDLRYGTDQVSAEDGCYVSWVCGDCGAHGLAKYKYAFDHHTGVEDANGNLIPGREGEPKKTG